MSARPTQERRPVLLVALVIGALLTAFVVTVLRGAYRDGPLEPDAPTPQGSRAVVTVLTDLGADVDVRRHTDDVIDALHAGRTVLVTDPSKLSDAQLVKLADAHAAGKGRLILVRPDLVTLAYFDTAISPAGTVGEPQTFAAGPDCGPAAFEARRLTLNPTESPLGSSMLYRSADGSVCFGDDGRGLVAVDGDLIVLGSADVLANATIRTADASAVALNAVGGAGDVIWYVPSASDPLASTGTDLLSRIPAWAGPAALWLLLSGLLLLIALAHRLGPVVVEPLPVSVKPQELVLGRAQLMQRARSRDAAAASLRSAAAVRLADRLGLRRTTGLDPLLAALAPHTSRTPDQLRALLGDDPIRTDPELVRLAQDLDTLEKEIDR